VQRQPPVIEESAEGEALIEGIADGGGSGRLVKNLGTLRLAPLEETLGEGSRSGVSNGFTFFAGRIRDGPFDAK
jgi:hypothetical protein